MIQREDHYTTSFGISQKSRILPSMLELLRETVEREATDLHIAPGAPPIFRINQRLVRSPYKVMGPEDTRKLVFEVLNDAQRARLERERELDFAISVEGLSRFRANAFYQRSTISASIRRIPFRIPSMAELGLPPIVEQLTQKSRGLILVTGPTGSGKSTTLASMIDRINQERACHIITIEDPIEYLHKNKKALIAQREVEVDTRSFATAIRSALRQDPDVIMVGEMRDLETIAAALTAAETGHLVLATLHTDSAVESINRIIDVFPPHQQKQVRVQLASTLEAVLSQRLLPGRAYRKLVLAIEVMIGTPAVRNLIREGRVQEIYGIIQTSQKYGMWTMNSYLAKLYFSGAIDLKTALAASPRQEELEEILQRRTMR